MNLAIHGIEANLGAAARRHASSATCTPTSRPTSSSPIRRSTSRDWSGQLLRGRRALGATATRPSATPTTPGSSTSSTTSPRPTAAAAAWPASSWPTARSRRATPAARARSAARSSRPTSSTASSPCPRSSSSPPASPSASGSSPATRPAGTSKHGGPRPAQGETLFIDARKLGTMQTRDAARAHRRRRRRELLCRRHGRPAPDSDIGRIVYAFRQWRGEPAPDWWNETEHGEWAYRAHPRLLQARDDRGDRQARPRPHPRPLRRRRRAGRRRRAVRREVPAAGGGVGGVLWRRASG